MNPEVLLAMLAELEQIRELTLDVIDRETPQLHPAPPDDASGTERTAFDLLVAARSWATLRPPEDCTTYSLPRASATQTPPAARGCATGWSTPKQWRTSDASGRW
jgi:hypothetical protein